ncbi:hypothetical protein CHGG_06026 [Chaetomium globosum CBS 148.51]|uniref:Uncharacterized protein n=1 Tax=Chaetomium globosum (strain ATCC 6205 / CBS 148.51 / DSM 1962 / NBRC 6347 / NRRL 1970) TaxID=306901 RepID=Q2H5N9_CHAGB|nr:uncharacterized protein CHGG_06026 [Chaetomium globosum CBS 148.51]EAQ89407.1 hypothetical protein CHGG_06026 [Chaetomium globosum CBS 148.51]
MNTATRTLRLAARQRFSTRAAQAIPNITPLTRLTFVRAMHTPRKEQQVWPTDTTSPEPRSHPNKDNKPAIDENVGKKGFADFNVAGKALVEAGGKVYALDRSPEPDEQWAEAIARVVPSAGGSLHYRQQNVADTAHLDSLIASIADENGRLDGAVAAAGVQQVTEALDYTPEDVARMLDVNYTGVFMTAQSVARQMFRYKMRGSICLIASMSGMVANKGLLSPVYNSSKAAVIQLAKNLAMEWSPVREDGTGGIRVNCISPGHILTPMVLKNFEEVPGLRETWEGENMIGKAGGDD